MRAAQRILMACLVCLPTAAFADVYPLNPPPDLFIDNFTYTGPTLTGFVETITDTGNCSALCFAGLNFYADINTLQITDKSGDTYLEGTFVAQAVEPGGEAGLLYDITVDNSALWSALEGQTASSFGPEVAIDIHDFYGTVGYDPDVTADLTPLGTTATPEPASLTLLFSGLAAGFARVRMARKKA